MPLWSEAFAIVEASHPYCTLVLYNVRNRLHFSFFSSDPGSIGSECMNVRSGSSWIGESRKVCIFYLLLLQVVVLQSWNMKYFSSRLNDNWQSFSECMNVRTVNSWIWSVQKSYLSIILFSSQLRFSGHKIEKNFFSVGSLKLFVVMYALSSFGLDWFRKVCFPI